MDPKFPDGEKMRVTVNGTRSRWAEVTSSAPQGSVLIRTIAVPAVCQWDPIYRWYKVTSKCLQMIQRSGVCSDKMLITQRFQEDLDRLTDWSKDWLLTYNAADCKTMHIGKHNPKAHSMKRKNRTRESDTEEGRCSTSVRQPETLIAV